MKAADGMVDSLEHPLDLVLAALVERELERRRAEAAHPGRRRPAVLELDAEGVVEVAAADRAPRDDARRAHAAG